MTREFEAAAMIEDCKKLGYKEMVLLLRRDGEFALNDLQVDVKARRN